MIRTAFAIATNTVDLDTWTGWSDNGYVSIYLGECFDFDQPSGRPGDGLKRLRAQVRSFRPSTEQRRMEPRRALPDLRGKGRSRRGRLPQRRGA